MKITLENVNPDKLSDEFIRNNIEVISVLSDLKEGEYVAKNAEFELGADSDIDLINNIVENHDPTPLPSPPTLEEQLAEKDAEILKLKEEQILTQQMTIQNAETQQELIELLMMMGVI